MQRTDFATLVGQGAVPPPRVAELVRSEFPRSSAPEGQRACGSLRD